MADLALLDGGVKPEARCSAMEQVRQKMFVTLLSRKGHGPCRGAIYDDVFHPGMIGICAGELLGLQVEDIKYCSGSVCLRQRRALVAWLRPRDGDDENHANENGGHGVE